MGSDNRLNTLVKVLYYLVLIHIILAFIVIIAPSVLGDSKLTRSYKVHVLPGPFFSNKSIVTNHYFLVSWHQKDIWTNYINPQKDNYTKYYLKRNPVFLYRLRLEKFLSAQILRKSKKDADVYKSDEYIRFTEYLSRHYIPNQADSIQVMFIEKVVKDRNISIDTVQIIKYSK
jgi:hypothetical protein